MKGLFVKDLRLMMIQGRVMAVVVVMVLVIWGIMGIADGGAVLGYVMVMLSIYIPSLISYDEMDNGYAWIFTMPASRREYVLEKYIFGIPDPGAGSGAGSGGMAVYLRSLSADRDPVPGTGDALPAEIRRRQRAGRDVCGYRSICPPVLRGGKTGRHVFRRCDRADHVIPGWPGSSWDAGLRRSHHCCRSSDLGTLQLPYYGEERVLRKSVFYKCLSDI